VKWNTYTITKCIIAEELEGLYLLECLRQIKDDVSIHVNHCKRRRLRTQQYSSTEATALKWPLSGVTACDFYRLTTITTIQQQRLQAVTDYTNLHWQFLTSDLVCRLPVNRHQPVKCLELARVNLYVFSAVPPCVCRPTCKWKRVVLTCWYLDDRRSDVSMTVYKKGDARHFRSRRYCETHSLALPAPRLSFPASMGVDFVLKVGDGEIQRKIAAPEADDILFYFFMVWPFIRYFASLVVESVFRHFVSISDCDAQIAKRSYLMKNGA